MGVNHKRYFGNLEFPQKSTKPNVHKLYQVFLTNHTVLLKCMEDLKREKPR